MAAKQLSLFDCCNPNKMRRTRSGNTKSSEVGSDVEKLEETQQGRQNNNVFVDNPNGPTTIIVNPAASSVSPTLSHNEYS